MQPKKPKKDIQSEGSAMLIQHKMLQKQKDDKTCQEIKRPKKSRNHMQSVTKNTDVQLSKPAVPYEYRRKCKEKNCQDTKSHKKQKKCKYKDSKCHSPVKYMCSGKNCQEKENNNMWSVSNKRCVITQTQ